MSAATLVQEARKASGLTQSALAARMGLPQSVVARLERPGSNPTWDTLARVLAATGHELNLRRPAGARAGTGPHTDSIPGPDPAQLQARLNLTPSERLRLFQASHESLGRLVAGARRRGNGA